MRRSFTFDMLWLLMRIHMHRGPHVSVQFVWLVVLWMDYSVVLINGFGGLVCTSIMNGLLLL